MRRPTGAGSSAVPMACRTSPSWRASSPRRVDPAVGDVCGRVFGHRHLQFGGIGVVQWPQLQRRAPPRGLEQNGEGQRRVRSDPRQDAQPLEVEVCSGRWPVAVERRAVELEDVKAGECEVVGEGHRRADAPAQGPAHAGRRARRNVRAAADWSGPPLRGSPAGRRRRRDTRRCRARRRPHLAWPTPRAARRSQRRHRHIPPPSAADAPRWDARRSRLWPPHLPPLPPRPPLLRPL